MKTTKQHSDNICPIPINNLVARARLLESVSILKSEGMYWIVFDHPDLCGKMSLPVATEHSMSGRVVSAWGNLLSEVRSEYPIAKEDLESLAVAVVPGSSSEAAKSLLVEDGTLVGGGVCCEYMSRMRAENTRLGRGTGICE